MKKRRWLHAVIAEAAKPQGPLVFSRQARPIRTAVRVPVQDKPIRAA